MLVRFDDLTSVSDGFELQLDQIPATLGRAGDATVRLTNWLTSRYHCEIDIQHNQLIVRDLASMNGTLLNGQAVEESPLAVGDTLQIGLQSFLVQSIDESLLTETSSKVADDSLVAAGV